MMKKVEKEWYTWFLGESYERIDEILQNIANVAIESMKNRQKEESIDTYDILESRIVGLKEHISQNNDIRSPFYEQNRQYIVKLNDLLVETYDKMLEEYKKWEEYDN